MTGHFTSTAQFGGPDGTPRRRRVRWHASFARRAGLGVLALGLCLGAVYVWALFSLDVSYWARIMVWRQAAYEDFQTKFASRDIPNAPPGVAFAPAPSQVPDALATIRYTTAQDGESSASLDEFLSRTQSTAFIVVKDNTLLAERYANGSSHTALQSSFSVAKSFDSTLVGIAISEGLIGSVDDLVETYLPELAGRGLGGVRIRHLLNMDSGLRYDGQGSGGTPWQDDARTYYDPDLRRLALSVQPQVEPGTRWQYNNYHPLLIGLILERVTGRSVSDYLSRELWQPLGMEAPATWSLDSQHDAFEKMESGLNARAIDFARFGQLFLNDGVWQGRQLVPRDWVETATRPRPDSPVDDYGYFWWIDTVRPGRFYALGNFGQFIYVAPDRDSVVVRFGHDYGTLSIAAWLATLRGVADAT